MRTAMREAVLQEKHEKQLSERRQFGDRLFEKWAKVEDVGINLDKIYEKNEDKARGLCLVLENEEQHLANLTETQISNAFHTTPHNVIRIVRLGYPNSIRGEVFTEWPMETARDALYYLKAVHATSRRGSTAESPVIETFEGRYPSEIEEHAVATGNASTKTWTVTLTYHSLRPYSIKILVADQFVATDDGAGNLIGALLDSSATNTIDYTTGALTITFTAAPANGAAIVAQYSFDSEDSGNFDDVGETQLQLTDYQFRVKPWPLFISWTKMTELLLGTTLNIDAEEALIQGAGDELKKALDYFALRAGWRQAQSITAITFDCTGAVGEAEVLRANAFSRAIDDAGNSIYNTIGRGGVTVIYGGAKALSYVKLHQRFTPDGAQPAVGAHRIGSLDGVGLYKCPTSIVPEDELICVFKNPDNEADTAMVIGSLIPLYQTQTLEYKNMYSETGIGFFGDIKTLNPGYFSRIKLSNL